MSSAAIGTSAGHTTWSGEQLLEALMFSSRLLVHHRDHVNALNVFPIPDGDTGTNMALTMNTSIEHAVKESNTDTAAHLADRFAFGALMGARGNSGVILSQIWRGFADGLAAVETIRGIDLARALDGAREKAYKAVMKPVEGTMLTVIRVAAETAIDHAREESTVAEVLASALNGARTALAQTPDMLEILKQAGVVDAGGQGVVYLLDGMYRFALGNTTIDEESTSEQIGAEMDFLDNVAELHGEDPFGYCTNFMVFGENIDFDAVRDVFNGMGQSVVAVGDDTVVKVHIHTENPGEVLSYALTLGYLDQIKIDNMTLQTEELKGQRHQNEGKAASAGIDQVVTIDGDVGIIAVAAGDGIAQALRSMGAHYIVTGGQTMNPSTEDILKAADALSTENIIVLPNNKNIVLAAEQAVALSSKHIGVVPTRSMADGLAALAAFSFGNDVSTNVAAMTTSLNDTNSVEMTRAVRDVEINGVDVNEGQYIALVQGDLVAAGDDLMQTLRTALARVTIDEPEILTVFTGAEADDRSTALVGDVLAAHFPDADIEVMAGGQPHYQFIIAVE